MHGDCILMYHGTSWRHGASLQRQLRALSVAFQVVPLREIIAPRTPRRRVALTFDDGLRSNVQIAYPILRALGLPATFFVCPGLVDSGRWLWNHEARERLASLAPGGLAELASHLGAPTTVEALVDWMKGMPLARRRRVEEEIRAATAAFRPTPAQSAALNLAGWAELKAMDARLISIGSHTMTHPILTSLDAVALEEELGGSRAALEAELGRPVHEFCYPNGTADFTAVEAVRRHYACAVGVQPGTLEGEVDRHLLPRFAAEAHNTMRLARRLALG